MGPALFFSLLVITLSFVPVFTLEAQEGRLFSPLAFTKTYAMAAAAGLSVTLVPVLMGYLIRGRIPQENSNPLNRFLMAAYRPLLEAVLRFPKATLVVAAVLLGLTAIPVSRLGGEFLPALDEGDLLYMPSALPGLSVSKATELLQQTDRLIKTVPEVERVFGKAGRADTATDPAPLEMFETTIQFKPREQWRPGMTPDKLVEELDRTVKVPGLSNIWVPPIRNRIDMLATGIKSPVGIKVAGPDLVDHRPARGPDRGRREGRARRVVGSGRAPDGRPLHRRRRRPAGGGPLRPVGGRRPGRRLHRHRRRQRRRGRPGARALPHQRALPARDPRLAREAAAAAVRHPQRRHGAAAGSGTGDGRGRAADAAQRERPPVGLGLRRRPRP